MARCYICDTYIEKPEIDPRDGQLRPCNTCEEAIEEDIRGDDEEFYFFDESDEDPSTLS